MSISKIEWTDASWNPLTGCSKISEGCTNCYAERMSHRLQKMGQKNYRNAFKLTLHPHMLTVPLKWKKPRLIFVNSMSDLFHEEVPLDYIKQVFEIMNSAQQHIFQVLTKRSTRLAELSSQLNWGNNIWMGVSIESDKYAYRANNLVTTKAKLKFLSLEPLLAPIPSLSLSNIDWVIVGGESGPHSRPIEKQWALEIKNKCQTQNIPFFFKQWGGTNKKKNGRLLNGEIWDQYPQQITHIKRS